MLLIEGQVVERRPDWRRPGQSGSTNYSGPDELTESAGRERVHDIAPVGKLPRYRKVRVGQDGSTTE